MEATRHLHVVDSQTGEVAGEQCSQCMALLKTLDRQEKLIANKQREIDELRHAKRQELATTDLAGDIMDVLDLHKRLLSPKASILRGGPAWKNVKARLEETDAQTGYLAFSKRKLQGAIVGLKLVDAEDGWYRRHGKIGAAFLFASGDRVNEFLVVCQDFRRETGVSALAIVDELAGPGLAWLAHRCTCGELRAAHLMGRGCDRFDEWQVEIERWVAKRERLAS